ncbi:MAG: hypothetical protein RIR26_2223, partial [Pseudomonadota bacterium]
MGERRGNRYYPHASLNSQGTFNPQIGQLLERAEQAIERGNFSAGELASTLKCCELLFWKGAWDKVEDLASRTIATGCGLRGTLRLYRFWIESLRADYNFIGLKSLGKHLLSLRHSTNGFLPLSVLALSYTGERRFSGKILRSAWNQTKAKSIALVEAFSVYHAESPQRVRREKGLQYLQALNVKNKSNYFLARNYLVYALENDYLEEASRAFELVHDRFPRCPEPFWGAARLAVAQGHWSEAARVLQELVADHPDNVDALIALAGCFEKTGDLLASRDILLSSGELFYKSDYDYAATLGTVSKKLFERYGMNEYREEAIRAYSQAITAAEKLGLSEAPLRVALNEIGGHSSLLTESAGQKWKSRQESTTAENISSPRAWILSVDDHDVVNFRRHTNLLMRSPGVVRKGDIVLVARRFGSDDWRT